MKLFLYCFRSFDETVHYNALSQQFDYSYTQTSDYPSIDNAILAKEADAISTTVCALTPEILKAWHSLGVKSLITRSIGYDHINLNLCRQLGLHVTHVAYPPESVAEYTIMLILMGQRKIRQTLERASIQDYTLKGKIGKDLCESTIGVLGTGRIGSCVAKYLSDFSAKILCNDPIPNPVLSSFCTYCPIETVF